jgi:dTDP-glucose 4,6-dehydratase
MKDKKRVLLTGIGGSIGSHTFAHIMKNTDWFVVGTDSFRHKGWTDRVKVMLNDHPDWADRLKIITHDLTSPFSELTKKRIGHIDYIISMAALSDVEASIQDPATFIRNNVEVALNMLEYAREVKPEVFIQISTDEVYGPSTKEYGHPEWSPILPSNPYSASKACQEAIAISYWRSYGVPLVITNTMNNFGEMQQNSKFPAIIQRKIANDEVITIHGKEGEIGSRYYIHSRNHADALIYIIKNLPPHLHTPGGLDKPDRYNIVGDVQLDNLELAQLIAKHMGKELKYEFVDVHATRPGHDRHYGLDGTKLKEKGWKSPVSFDESIKNTIQWQSENAEWIQ